MWLLQIILVGALMGASRSIHVSASPPGPPLNYSFPSIFTHLNATEQALYWRLAWLLETNPVKSLSSEDAMEKEMGSEKIKNDLLLRSAMLNDRDVDSSTWNSEEARLQLATQQLSQSTSANFVDAGLFHIQSCKDGSEYGQMGTQFGYYLGVEAQGLTQHEQKKLDIVLTAIPTRWCMERWNTSSSSVSLLTKSMVVRLRLSSSETTTEDEASDDSFVTYSMWNERFYVSPQFGTTWQSLSTWVAYFEILSSTHESVSVSVFGKEGLNGVFGEYYLRVLSWHEIQQLHGLPMSKSPSSIDEDAAESDPLSGEPTSEGQQDDRFLVHQDLYFVRQRHEFYAQTRWKFTPQTRND